MVAKLKSGIFGLNALLGGGINPNTVTVIIGAAGTGKTTSAIQFIRRGLEGGHDGVFVSLDEAQTQIIRSAIEMGWKNIREYIDDGKLVFIDASGKKFAEFINTKLPAFSRKWRGTYTRVAIDPLTPVIWSTKDKYAQREIINSLFRDTKRIGTVLCTLEEHRYHGDLVGSETIIPMYLADAVIHLRHVRDKIKGCTERTIEVLKCRDSRHSTFVHTYRIIKGLGLVVLPGGQKEDQVDKNMINLLRSKLEPYADKLPPSIYERLLEATKHIRVPDIEDADLTALMSELIEEYSDLGTNV